MLTTRRNTKNKRPAGKSKSRVQTVLSVISVRVSDEEKERIDEIMRTGNFRNYTDVLRMAIQMFKVPDIEAHKIEQYH